MLGWWQGRAERKALGGFVNIVGISAFYHDSAVALLRDGAIVAAAQEERFSRKKHDARFPSNALAWCMREGGLVLGEVDAVVFYDKPLAKFDRLLETYLAYGVGHRPIHLYALLVTDAYRPVDRIVILRVAGSSPNHPDSPFSERGRLLAGVYDREAHARYGFGALTLLAA